MNAEEQYETLDPENWDEMSELAHRMVDDAISYLKNVRERPVWRQVPDEIAEHFKDPVPLKPTSADEVYQQFLEDVFPYPVGNVHPRFWAWYMGSGTIFGALGEFMASIMNPNSKGGNQVSTILEEQVINWIKEMVGFPSEASGILVSGSSMAAIIGLTVARNTLAGFDVRVDGLQECTDRMTMYASSEIHSSNQKAIELLGLGSRNFRRVPVKSDYAMDLEALKATIATDRSEGYRPLCVIGSAGTINTGAIDDLNAIADLCEQENMWFHVDGAIGAVGVLAQHIKPLLSGMERADSIAMDLHKAMHIPFEAGCALVRSKKAHRNAFTLTPEYLARDTRGLAAGELWFSDYGLQLSRQFRALKVWMSIKEHGLERFGRMIDRNVAQAHYFGQLVENDPEMELLAPIGMDIVCFRFNPGGLDDTALNSLNKDILVELQEQGIAAPSYTTLNGRYCLRIAIANHRSRLEDFDVLAREVVRIGRELINKQRYQDILL